MKKPKKLSNFHSSQFGVYLFVGLFALVGTLAIWFSSADAPKTCPLVGDFNCDGKVNMFDLSALLNNYGSTNTIYDLNHDGKVNFLDISLLLNHYGETAMPVTEPAVQAKSADDFVNSIGVNIHLSYLDTAYGNWDK